MIEIIIFLQVVIVIGGPIFLIHINKRVGSYASEVGKITAINKKIDDVVAQQKKITEATEQAKSEIAHLAWNKKEAQTVKRQKLEEYIEMVFKTLEVMPKSEEKTSEAGKVEMEPLPFMLIPKLTTIQMLYLPELEVENKKFVDLIKKHEAASDDLYFEKINIEDFKLQMLESSSLFGGVTKEIILRSKQVIDEMFES